MSLVFVGRVPRPAADAHVGLLFHAKIRSGERMRVWASALQLPCPTKNEWFFAEACAEPPERRLQAKLPAPQHEMKRAHCKMRATAPAHEYSRPRCWQAHQ